MCNDYIVATEPSFRCQRVGVRLVEGDPRPYSVRVMCEDYLSIVDKSFHEFWVIKTSAFEVSNLAKSFQYEL